MARDAAGCKRLVTGGRALRINGDQPPNAVAHKFHEALRFPANLAPHQSNNIFRLWATHAGARGNGAPRYAGDAKRKETDKRRRPYFARRRVGRRSQLGSQQGERSAEKREGLRNPLSGRRGRPTRLPTRPPPLRRRLRLSALHVRLFCPAALPRVAHGGASPPPNRPLPPAAPQADRRYRRWGYPRAAPGGVTSPARPRRPPPPSFASHENALGMGRIGRDIVQRGNNVKRWF